MNNFRCFTIYFILATATILSPLLGILGQTKKFSPQIEKNIALVEKNLASAKLSVDSPGRTIAERMKYYHTAGLSIAVIKNYKMEWSKGYGWADSAEGRRVNTSTLFQAASISKSINAIGALKLVQEEKLDLYTDINAYLKTWQFPYDTLSRGKKISLANLLSHTAGLTVHGFPGYVAGDSLPTLIQVLEGKRPANTLPVLSLYVPSTRFKYSGGGTTIVQKMIEDISGQSYDQFMWENVLKPLGMTNSFFTQPPPKNKWSRLATGHYNDGMEVKGKYHIYPEQAAAGLWTNPTDLAKYIIETQLSLEGRSAKVLSPEMTRRRLTPYIDSSIALGVFITNIGGQKYFSHSGSDEGFMSQYYGSMKGGNGVIVMTNSYNSAIITEVINSVAIVYKWKGFFVPKVKKIAAPVKTDTIPAIK